MLNSKHSRVPFSSSTEDNSNNSTESNIPSQSDHEDNSNNSTESNIPSQSDHAGNTYSVSPLPHDAHRPFQSAKPLDVMTEGYLLSLDNIFNVADGAEYQHSCHQNVLDLKYEQAQKQNSVFPIDPNLCNNQLISYSQLWLSSTHTKQSFSRPFASPSLHRQDHIYNAAKPSGCDQLVDSWTTLPRSANIALGCANAIPTLVEIGDSLKGKIENVGQIINENENKIMKEYSSFTASSGITARSASHSHSKAADFTDVDPEPYTTHKEKDYEGLHEKTTEQSWVTHDSSSQFNAPGILFVDVDQYGYIQAQPQDGGKDQVNLGVPTYINIHRQKSYQFPQIGGVQDVNQWDCSTIPNEDSKATPTPTILGKGRSRAFDFQCESESSQITVCAQDDYVYSIHNDTATSSDLDQFCFT